MSRSRQFPVHEDSRGTLLPVELDDVEFPARRVFVVNGPEGGADRGGHQVPCRELLVLITGRAEIHVGTTQEELDETVVLEQPGAAAHLQRGEFMAYRLGEGSSVLVLAEEPYADSDRQRRP